MPLGSSKKLPVPDLSSARETPQIQSLSVCPLGSSTHSDLREYPNLLPGQDWNEGLIAQAWVRHGWSPLLIAFEHPNPQGLAPRACGEGQGCRSRAVEAG